MAAVFAEERIRKIKEILWKYERVDINTLTSLLNASVTTVRRDLDRLENEGFLTKAHGGAILNTGPEPRPAPVSFEPEKLEIARLAARYIEDNDVVFLGSGPICHMIAREIREKKELQVVTNNLQAACELSGLPSIQTYVTGGELETVQGSVIASGPAAVEQVSQFLFRKAFLPFSGVSLERGYTHSVRSEALLFRALLRQATETVAVADAARFDTVGLLPVCPLEQVQAVFTNVSLPDRYKDYYLKHGIRLFTSFQSFS